MKLDLAARLDRRFFTRTGGKAARGSHSLEILEARIAPAVTTVASIVRAGGAPPETAADHVDFTVTFSEAVSNVDAADFLVHTDVAAHANPVVTVTPATGPATAYTVTVSNLHGQGDVRLDLVDNDSINGTIDGALGGAGAGNGSFQGAAYHLLQAFPKVVSIAANGSTTTNASSVSWTVTLSAPVTGVDATDFTLLKSGVSTDAAVTVTLVSSTVYTVTATHVSGNNGTLALQLVDDGTIKDANLNPLQGTPPPSFAAQASLAAGRAPFSVAVADVNGDGKPDLVTANYSDKTVSVLLGNGSGGFAAKTDFATGSGPLSVAVGDVNGDGRLDLVTANTFSATVSVLLGNGSGGFGTKTDFATGSEPSSVAVADVNGDGKPDLVTANSFDNNVSVLLGNGSGSFAAKTDFDTGVTPDSVVVADVNGDGRPDLVTTNLNGNPVGHGATVSVLLGNGSGGFTAQPTVATGGLPDSVAVADVNGDGRPDLVVTANAATDNVSVLLGNGSGGFTLQPTVATGIEPYSVAVADVNGDGQRDLVTANAFSATVSVLLGNGSGGFGVKTDFATGTSPRTVVVADVNGDGQPDLVTANVNSSTVSVLLSTSGGDFTGDSFTILPPTISIADTSVLEGNTGTPHATFIVSLSNASYLPVTVDFSTADGTAIAPGDYTAIPHGTLTFAPGETSRPISVAIRPDTLFESGGNETLLVHLSNPVHATLGDALGVGTILADDGAPAHQITLDAKHPFTFFDHNHDQVTVKLTGLAFGTLILDGGVLDGADISEINVAGNAAASTLSIAVTKDKTTGDGLVRVGEVTVDGALLSFSGPAVDLTVGGLRALGPVKTITAHALLAGEILTRGAATDHLALTLGALGAGGDPFLIATAQTISALKAASVGVGEIDAAALTSVSVSAGPLAADITSAGAIGSIVVKGGDVSGELTASRFGAVSVTGGDFRGVLTSLTPAATLRTTKALTSLTVSDGNLTGDIRLHGASGAITVTTKPALLAAGSISGASIVASAIASLTVARDFISSIVLAGADLGDDYAFGGSTTAADTFAAGTIGAVKIGRNASGAGSIIGAGFSSTNAMLKDGDDAIIGGVASVIASLNVTGTAAPESYFAAGLFKAAPKIGGVAVPLAGDGRFKVG